MKRLMILLIVGLVLVTSAASGHSLYDWYCCEDQHCHAIPCEELTRQGKSLIWKGFEFTEKMFKLSPDGQCHTCIIKNGEGIEIPRCLYLPVGL